MAWHPTWNEPPRRSGFFVDRGGLFPPGVRLILFLTAGVFLLEMLGLAGSLFGVAALSVTDLLRLQVWRLVTYMFLHASMDHILINMFMFWMLGMALERQIGTKQFLALYFACGVLGGAFEAAFNGIMYFRYASAGLEAYGHTFLSMPAVGASAGVAGVLVAFATLNPRAKFLVLFIVPVEAWLVALVYVLIETRHVAMALLQNPAGRIWADNVAHAAHFGGMVLGFVWIKWAGGLRRLWRWHPAVRPEGFLSPDAAAEEAEMDRILDKIHEQGLDSLTLRERMFLQDISRRRRGGP
jgi:membrane associated rhomboid family serine protease